jgi:hypothetical protein
VLFVQKNCCFHQSLWDKISFSYLVGLVLVGVDGFRFLLSCYFSNNY